MDFTITTQRIIDLMEQFEDGPGEVFQARKMGRQDSKRSEYAKERDRSHRLGREAKAFSF